MKKRYLISYTGLFESGYVILNWIGPHGKVKRYDSAYEMKKDATRFRFKFMADFWCWNCNVSARRNGDLRTFKVCEA